MNSHTRNVRSRPNPAKAVVLACALILALAAPLHAQYTLTDIYDFNCATGGCYPEDYGQLTRFTDGKLYGTTSGGGTSGWGTIFSVFPDGSSYSDVGEFDSSTGATPASLMLAGDGNFYSGASACPGTGELFRFTSPSTLKVFPAFPSCGFGVPPVEAQDGNLYGFYGSSSVYRFNLKTQVVTLLKPDAPGELTAPLILANDGYMYGVTFDGGSLGYGTVFRVTPGSGAVKTIYNFTNGTDGCGPEGPLFQFPGSVDTLYGTTSGVSENCSDTNGTAFQLVLGKKPVLTTMHTFAGSDGAYPMAGLVPTPSGSLLSVTTAGGANGTGTAFEIDTTSPFSFNKVADFFPGPSNNGPVSTLLANTDGSYYGVVIFGGANGDGYVYKLTPLSIFPTVMVEGPVWVPPGAPVTILGDNLEETVGVTFAGQSAEFQIGSNTYLTATVPAAAVDGPLVVTITSPAGGEEQLQAQQDMHILPLVTNLDPTSGPVGQEVDIVGGGFTGATKVTFGGVKATSFTVLNPTLIQAAVPTGAKTGKVAVTTPNGAATSKEKFTVN